MCVFLLVVGKIAEMTDVGVCAEVVNPHQPVLAEYVVNRIVTERLVQVTDVGENVAVSLDGLV